MNPAFRRIQISGAAGSGTSTLGRELARRIDAARLDVDDFLWRPSEPPFVERRDPAERTTMVHGAIDGRDR